jgi:crotonobetainyl-CoA:carnitine CoA-transferase CaiB-like acyl-CoA transferase
MSTTDLEGVLVIAVEQAVAAPLCTSRLADAGARVIKIERPEGDFARRYDKHVKGQSTYFVWLNRGKESVRLDLKEPQDHALLSAMIASADVLVQNLAPGSMKRMGLGSADLRQRHPRLITCDVSGYGEEGPYRDMKAYDLLIQAESGLASVTGSPESAARVGVSVCDIAAGLYAHSAILQALYARQTTGKGRGIAVSLFAGMADWMNVPYLQKRYGGSAPPRPGLKHPSIAPYGVFSCRDGDVLLSVQNEREWARLCTDVLDNPALTTNELFKDLVTRVANRADLDARINTVFGRRARKDVAAALFKADIAYGVLNDVDGLIGHPQLRTVTYDTPEGEVTVIAPPAVIAGETPRYRPVPAVGVHDAAIRAEFGRGQAGKLDSAERGRGRQSAQIPQ